MTQAAKLSSFTPTNWTTATRPASPNTGQMGYNTTIGAIEYYNGSTWSTSGGLSTQSVQTTGFTAVAGNLYPCNTTSAAFTVTLPASPTVGNQIQIVDYAGTFATNALTVGRNGSNIAGVASNYLLNTNRESVILTYIDSTQGWVVSSAAYTTSPLTPPTYTATYLVVAGGAGGAGDYGGGGGAGGYLSGTFSTTYGSGIVYTATVGAGSPGSTGGSTRSTNGSNSSLSGSNITTVTALGGGGAGAELGGGGLSGGSGGGAAYSGPAGGSGTPGQGNTGGNGGGTVAPNYVAGGGGGSGAVGANGSGTTTGAGGTGTASSITGTPVTYAGGGGGGHENNNAGSTGQGGTNGGPAGSPGGGGNGGAYPSTTGSAGTANTGGGGGGGLGDTGVGGNGGSGVVILSLPTANYTGTTTGSPTITTSGSNTIIKWTTTGSGTYTA